MQLPFGNFCYLLGANQNKRYAVAGTAAGPTK